MTEARRNLREQERMQGQATLWGMAERDAAAADGDEMAEAVSNG